MSIFVRAFLEFATILGIIFLVMGLVVYGLYQAIEVRETWKAGIVYWVAAFLLVTVTVATVHTLKPSRSLCVRGHEEFQRIGKTLERVWVCDEAQR